jgi:putative membrane protein
MPELLRLLWGTVLLRPYVFAFLAVYLLASSAQSGWRRTLLFIPIGYSIAWVSEFSSIHWGFPYGDYFYVEDTLDRELWVMGVPFMDSLSYVFLAYCSFSTAIFVLSPVRFTAANAYILENHALRRSRRTHVLGAFLFVLLDIIIDPVALQGYRWFLGQIYGYREPGVYFGIPLSNFAGWLLVGFAMTAALQALDSIQSLEPNQPSHLHKVPFISLLGTLLYISVLVFNLSVTVWIGERLLAVVGSLLTFFPALLAFFFTLYKQDHTRPRDLERHRRDFPHFPSPPDSMQSG